MTASLKTLATPLALLAAATLLSGCIVVPAGHYPRSGVVVSGGGPVTNDGEYVTVAPPSPQVEVVVAPPGPGYFWIGGFWNWVGGRHVWVGGHWEAHRPGYQYAPHQWRREGNGWRQAPGRWERR